MRSTSKRSGKPALLASAAGTASLLASVVVGVASAPPAGATGAPAQVAFTVEPPSTAAAGASFAVEVAIEDSSGNVVTSDSSDLVTLGTQTGPSEAQCSNGGSALVSVGRRRLHLLRGHGGNGLHTLRVQ
jgi:hypothetical protein